MEDSTKKLLSELNIVSSSGVDYRNKPIITIFASNIPRHANYTNEEIFDFINSFMPTFTHQEYSLLYFNDYRNTFGLFSTKLLLHIHGMLEHAQRKNVTTVYIVHSTALLRFFIRSLWFLSRKLYNKIIYVEKIMDLEAYMNLSTLSTPQNILSYDKSLTNNIAHAHDQPENIFGANLASILMENNHLSLPFFLQTCFKNIRDNVNKEGIFRISPKLADINAFCDKINKNSDCSSLKPEIAIGIVKRFLKTLSTPILGTDAWPLMKSLRNSTSEEKHRKIQDYMNSLPECNKFMLKHLFCLFDFINENRESNKMDHYNLSIVLAPNFLWGESSLLELLQDSLASIEFFNFLLVNHLTLLNCI